MDAYTGKRESPVRVATMGDDWTGVGVIAWQRIAAPQWSFFSRNERTSWKKNTHKKIRHTDPKVWSDLITRYVVSGAKLRKLLCSFKSVINFTLNRTRQHGEV